VPRPGHRIVTQSAASRNALFGGLELVFVVAFVRGVPGAATSAGAVAAGVFCTAVILGVAFLWRRTNQMKSYLDISNDAIALMSQRRQDAIASISRGDGAQLQFVMRGGARYRNLCLVQSTTGTSILLPLYTRAPIKSACVEHGWQLD
jgi:hypothetical protein